MHLRMQFRYIRVEQLVVYLSTIQTSDNSNCNSPQYSKKFQHIFFPLSRYSIYFVECCMCVCNTAVHKDTYVRAHTHRCECMCVVVHEYLPLSLFGEKEIQFLFWQPSKYSEDITDLFLRSQRQVTMKHLYPLLHHKNALYVQYIPLDDIGGCILIYSYIHMCTQFQHRSIRTAIEDITTDEMRFAIETQ